MRQFRLKNHTVKYKEIKTGSNYNVSISVFKNGQLISGTIGRSLEKDYVKDIASWLIDDKEKRNRLESLF